MVAGLGLVGAACSVEVPEETGDKKPTESKKPAKGGGQKGAEAAEAGQKSGDNATASKESAAAQGTESDGVVCDASLEGVGWCADDASIVFCSADSWWLLDCTAYDPEAFCAYDLDLEIVDCYVFVDDEEEEEECLDIDEACDEDLDCCSEVCDVDGSCS